MEVENNKIKLAHSVYTKIVLKFYDLWVLKISNHFIWRCPTSLILQQYHKYVSKNHLDIGVGTGYYLKHCQWEDDAKLSLMDLNKNCLEKCQKTLFPMILHKVICKNIYEEPGSNLKFDSISLNYVLHCLPGNMKNKRTAIKHAAQMLNKDGVLFGASILGEEKYHHLIGKKLQYFYQKKGIFNNQFDTLKSLKNVLEEFLFNVEVKLIGAVTIFVGRRSGKTYGGERGIRTLGRVSPSHP